VHVTSCEVRDADRCVDRRGRQDRRRGVDRHQDRLRQVHHRDRRDVRHQDHQVRQDEDQNQDDRQGHWGHPCEDHQVHQDQDGIHQDHRGVRHQGQDEHRDHQDDRQDLGGNHLDRDVKYQVPCADQVVAEYADLLKKRGQEVAESEVGLQADAHQVACPEAFRLVACLEATGHVQRGALGVSLEAD